MVEGSMLDMKGKTGRDKEKVRSKVDENVQKLGSTGDRCIGRTRPAARALIDLDATVGNAISTKTLTRDCVSQCEKLPAALEWTH